MSRKPRFKPKISRIKLNPEQAVLFCDCFDTGWRAFSDGTHWGESSGAVTSACDWDGGRYYFGAASISDYGGGEAGNSYASSASS